MYKEGLLNINMASITSRALAKGTALPAVNPELMRLYSMRFCPFAQRTRIVLLHKDIEHETVNCNLKYKAPWLLDRNPRGLVPVLEYKGTVVFESVICGDFLDDFKHEKKLYSGCPFRKSQQKLLMNIFDEIPKLFYRVGNPDPRKAALARETIGNTMSLLENELGEQKFFGGSDLSMVDIHIFPWFERIPAIKELSDYNVLPEHKYPRLTRWYKNMIEVPAVKDTMYSKEWHMHFIGSLFNKNPQYDIGLDQVAQAKL